MKHVVVSPTRQALLVWGGGAEERVFDFVSANGSSLCKTGGDGKTIQVGVQRARKSVLCFLPVVSACEDVFLSETLDLVGINNRHPCNSLPSADNTSFLKTRVFSMKRDACARPRQVAPCATRLLGGQGGENRRHPLVANAVWPWRRAATTQPRSGTRNGARNDSGNDPGSSEHEKAGVVQGATGCNRSGCRWGTGESISDAFFVSLSQEDVGD